MNPTVIPILPDDERGRPHDVIAADQELSGQYGSYLADPGLINAANTALGLELPLLLTGEPGCGKSDFAWVAAHALHLQRPLVCLVRSDTRARDLLYHYDALNRFGDAQHGDRTRAQDPRNYVRLRPLGVGLMTAAPRQVVLIDEIDKAPRDLPNDLLRELDEGHFEIPEIEAAAYRDEKFDEEHRGISLRRHMQRPGARKPFVVITSNAERQLPEPFLRRCVFYHIPPPGRERLLAIVERRFRLRASLTTNLTDIFVALRLHVEQSQLTKSPTTSEMIAWVQALTVVYRPDHVDRVVPRFAEAVARGGKLPAGDLTWAALPGISVLIKHKEDLFALGHGHAGSG